MRCSAFKRLAEQALKLDAHHHIPFGNTVSRLDVRDIYRSLVTRRSTCREFFQHQAVAYSELPVVLSEFSSLDAANDIKERLRIDLELVVFAHINPAAQIRIRRSRNPTAAAGRYVVTI